MITFFDGLIGMNVRFWAKLLDMQRTLSRPHTTDTVARGRPSQKKVPRLLTVMRTCQFRGYLDARAKNT